MWFIGNIALSFSNFSKFVIVNVKGKKKTDIKDREKEEKGKDRETTLGAYETKKKVPPLRGFLFWLVKSLGHSRVKVKQATLQH